MPTLLSAARLFISWVLILDVHSFDPHFLFPAHRRYGDGTIPSHGVSRRCVPPQPTASHAPAERDARRRSFLLTLPTVFLAQARPVAAADDPSAFHSAATGREEYTNSIVASRDTNISPKEVYDTIASAYVTEAVAAAQRDGRPPRALDVGAGAGVSTEVLHRLGARDIVAVDWSGAAWAASVVDDPAGRCPPGVAFLALDDERYLARWRAEDGRLFDAIVFNFAVNEAKAKLFAKELLDPRHGRLLAPINTSNDYWNKQTYKVLDGRGDVLWSAADVGAWSVQFQPDVTQDTCSGVWCAPFNGFQKKQ